MCLNCDNCLNCDSFDIFDFYDHHLLNDHLHHIYQKNHSSDNFHDHHLLHDYLDHIHQTNHSSDIFHDHLHHRHQTNHSSDIFPRNRAFSKVNEELVKLYYHVGNIVSLKVSAGTWGDGTVNELASYIDCNIPGIGGFNRRGLYRMKQFYETYAVGSDCYNAWLNIQDKKETVSIVSPLATQLNSSNHKDIKIVSPKVTQIQTTDNNHIKFMLSLLTQVSWTNHLEILSGTKTPEEKLFYLTMTNKDKLKKMELRRQLKSCYFERSMLSKQPVSSVMIQIPDTFFKDPYVFEFLDLPDRHSETDLEKALILNLKNFILEIGKGFTYMGNQFRLQVGNKDFHTDLLFYHRDLQCMVLFELKTEEFEPDFMGRLNFYLEALDRDVKRPHENPTIGILLCKGKNSEVVEYSMARNVSPAVVVDYETKLIDKKVLTDKLHQLMELLNGDGQDMNS